METAFPALLQYGAVGAIAVLAITALAYVTRRYIGHLEANEERQAEAWDRVAARLGDVRKAQDQHEQNDRDRHLEVLRTVGIRDPRRGGA